MSRRDTILIAVLVNAAILTILFITAIRTEDSPATPNPTKVTELAKAPVVETLKHEDLLNEYITSVPTLAETNKKEILAFNEEPLAFTPPPKAPEVIREKEPPIRSQIQPPSTRETADEKYVQITVKKGDFLEKIAKSNNTTVAALMKANQLSSTQLKVGQLLKVPLTGEGPAEKKPSMAHDDEFYTVREGDNPWLIASRNKINLEELLRLNGLDDAKAKRLRPGDRLRIR